MIIDFLLDNPGFSDSITDVQDAPKSSGSSPASRGQPQRSCARCHSRMSSIDRDKHLIYIRCRGYECSVNLRCEECENWSKEEMLAHEKIRKSLVSKSIGRGKSSTRVVKKPASPPKTSADVDLDNRFAVQYGRMLKKMDDRMQLPSSSLLNQIRSIFDNPRSNNLYPEEAQVSGLAQAQGSGNKSLLKSKPAQPINYSDDASAFPGQSSDQTVP